MLAKIAAGVLNTMYLITADGTAWSWGGDFAGQLGDDATDNRSSPVSVVGNHSFTGVFGSQYSSFGLKQDGTLWTWGSGSFGNLGINIFDDDSTDNRSSPVSVVGAHSFTMAAGNDFSLALKADGTAWGWGFNTVGSIGDGTVSDRSSPVSVVGAHSFIFISANDSVGLALKADGSAWTWGANYEGTLGNNEANGDGDLNRSSPVSVVGAHSFIMINGGEATTIAALRSDGSAWAWGNNSLGSLGQGTDIANRSSPVSAVGGHSFISVKSGAGNVAALKADGSVWTWGNGGLGVIGNNATNDRSSPVSVVGNHSFVAIDTQGTFVVALKADNSAWTWGENIGGALGNNSIGNRSSPVSVVGLPF
jgi:alpha-tubulin suppressor-like RCC1 family protein